MFSISCKPTGLGHTDLYQVKIKTKTLFAPVQALNQLVVTHIKLNHIVPPKSAQNQGVEHTMPTYTA